jgi:hypothetical protein
LKLVSSLRIELSFKVGRVGTLGGRVRVGPYGEGKGLGTLGVNLNLVSSSNSKLRLRLSFIIGMVGTLGEGLGTLGGGQGWGPVYHPVHAMFPGAHLDTPQGRDFSNSSARNVPRCTPRNPSGLGQQQQHRWVTS